MARARLYCVTCHVSHPTEHLAASAERVALESEIGGLRHQARKQWQAAIDAFSDAIKQSAPHSALHMRCLHARALSHVKSESPDRASCLKDLDELLEIEPRHRAGRFLRADMRGETVDVRGAKDDYEFILEHLDANAITAIRSKWLRPR